MSLPITAKADLSTEPLVKTYVGYVNGVERTTKLTSDPSGLNTYFKIGEGDFQRICRGSTVSGPDIHSVIWNYRGTVLSFWSYDLTPSFDSTVFAIYRDDVASVTTEGSGTQEIITGYTTLSGETCPLPSFDTLKSIKGIDEPIPEPFYAFSPDATPIPTQTPELSSPTPIPVTTEAPMPTPILSVTQKLTVSPTVQPTVTKPIATPKLSIKKSKTSSTIYEGKKVVSKITLKKGTLTWKRWVEKTKRYKTKRYKGVKGADLILKSKNMVYMPKKGIVDILSYKTGKRIKRYKGVLKKSTGKIKLTSGKKISIKNL